MIEAVPGAGFDSVEAVALALDEHDYLADEGLATAVFLALRMQRPLLLEGEAGVGKTEVAKVLAALDRRRADPAAVLRGHRRVPRRSTSGTTPASCCTCAPPRPPAGGGRGRRGARGRAVHRAVPRPPPAARRPSSTGDGPPPVLLIDEIDRADDEFEAFLLEMLVRLHGHGPRARHVPGRRPAGRGPHVEPHPRRARRAQAALPLPLGRAPRLRPRGRDRPAPGARGSPERPGPPGRGGRRSELRELGLTSRRAWPRRSTGPRRSPRSARDELDADHRRRPRLGAVLKYREDAERVPRHGLGDLVAAPIARTAVDRARGGRASTAARRRRRRRRGLAASSARVAGAGGPSTRPVDRVVRARTPSASTERDDGLLGRTGHARPTARGHRLLRPGLRRVLRRRPSPPPSVEPVRDRHAVAVDDDAADGTAADDDADPATTSPRLRYRAEREVLRHKDFAAYTDDELAEARRSWPSSASAGALSRSRRCAVAPSRRRRRPARPRAAPSARAAHRRRARAARAPREPASGPAASCCCSTSAARWSPTPGPCCASSTPPWPPAQPGRGVHPRHPADPAHPRARRPATPTSALAPGGRRGRRLVGRHPARRRPAAVQRRVGRAGHGPRRRRRHPVRRVGPRRPRRSSPSRWSGCTASPTASSGSTRSRPRRATRRWPRGMAAALPARRRVRRGPLAWTLARGRWRP